MCVFRPSYKRRDGTSAHTTRYYVEFYDHNRCRHRVPAYEDEAATRDLNRRIVELVVARDANRPIDGESRRWVTTLPRKLRQRLADIGLVDVELGASLRPMDELVEDWAEHLRAKGTTDRQTKQVTKRARLVMAGAGATLLQDLDASRVEQFLRREREQGVSIRTSNFHLQATRQFVRWAVRRGLLADDPLRAILPLNPAVDRRRERRALTIDEVRALLAATESGPARDGTTGAAAPNGLPGPERALIYRLAVETGLRRNEVKTLRVADLDLEDEAHALVRVRPVHAKNRKDTFLPLRAETAHALAAFLRGRPLDAPVFACPTCWRSAAVLREDLAAAGVPYADASGRVVDFHALRTTFGTTLARCGVTLQVAQRLMRHSSPSLTSNIYTVLGRADERAAVSTLPDLARPGASSEERPRPVGARPDTTSRSGAGDVPLLVDAAGAAALLGMSRAQLRRCDSSGDIPRALRIGPVRRWSRRELQSWVRAGCPSRSAWDARTARATSAAVSLR